MTSYFLDLNVWLALSDGGHIHHSDAKAWFDQLPYDARLIFSRYTQIGLLRLLTNASVMGDFLDIIDLPLGFNRQRP